jgi:hypothetical protein
MPQVFTVRLKNFASAVIPWLLFTFFTTSAPAQTTLGSILGVATDPSGAAVPGVAIIVQNTGTGIEHRRVTNASGLYEVPNIIPGVGSQNRT